MTQNLPVRQPPWDPSRRATASIPDLSVAFLARGQDVHRRIAFDLANHIRFGVGRGPAGIAWARCLCLAGGPVRGRTGTPWRVRRRLGVHALLVEFAREPVTHVAGGRCAESLGFPARSRQLMVAT
jgi:hypothetical protein